MNQAIGNKYTGLNVGMQGILLGRANDQGSSKRIQVIGKWTSLLYQDHTIKAIPEGLGEFD